MASPTLAETAAALMGETRQTARGRSFKPVTVGKRTAIQESAAEIGAYHGTASDPKRITAEDLPGGDDDQGDKFPEDLRQVITAWRTLPEKTRREILDLIPAKKESRLAKTAREFML